MADEKDTEAREREKRERQERETEGSGDDSRVDQAPGEEGIVGGVPGSVANKPTG